MIYIVCGRSFVFKIVMWGLVFLGWVFYFVWVVFWGLGIDDVFVWIGVRKG